MVYRYERYTTDNHISNLYDGSDLRPLAPARPPDNRRHRRRPPRPAGRRSCP